MPTYQIKAPNGQTYRVDGPEGATDEQVQAEVIRQFPEAGGQTGPAEAAPAIALTRDPTTDYREHLQALINAGASKDQVSAYAKAQGVDPSTIQNLDEAIDYVKRGGRNVDVQEPSGDEGGILHDAAVAGKGLIKGLSDVSGMVLNPGAQLAKQITGAPTASDLVEGASQTYDVGAARTAGERELEASGYAAGSSAPFGVAGGMTGALLSGAAAGGVSQGLKENGYGTGAQLAGGVLAGLGAGGLASAGARAAGSFGPRTASPLMQAFDAEQVPALAADVGGAGSRMASGFANMTLGGIPLSEAAERSVLAAKTARSRIAESIGTPARDVAGRSDNLGAGLAVQRGVKAVLGDNGTKQTVGEKLYQAIPVKPDTPAKLANTRQALDDLTEGYASNPALSELTEDKRLSGYQNALANGGLNWRDLKSFRSYIGELSGRATLQDSTAKNALQRLYAGLSEDMRATAATQGEKALSSFTRANNYWRGLEARREQVLKPLLGNDLSASGESAFKRIEQWSSNSGDVFALGRTLRSLPDDEANTVRATIFDRLGNVSKGRQDEAGMVFSPNDFVTHWQGLSSRAKATLFPGSEYRDSIDNLVRIAAAQKGAQKYANVSKTGNAFNGIALLTGFFTNPLGTMPVAVGQLGFGKLLASPRFARWLASAPAKPNPAAALAHVNRLGAIAGAEPAIANEVLKLQERLASAFTNAPMRAAAEPGDEVGQGQGNTTDQQAQDTGVQP